MNISEGEQKPISLISSVDSEKLTVNKLNYTTTIAAPINVQSLGESLAKFAASLTELKMALPLFIPDFSPFLTTQKSLIASVTSICKMSEMCGTVFEGLHTALEQIDQRYWAILPYLKQAGFALSPSTPIFLLTDIEELVSNGCATPENVCKVLVEISEVEDYALLREMVTEWKQEQYYSNRAVLLDDALDAHINKKYSLSIPAMLPLIEGYFDSCFSEREKRNLIARMKEHFGNIDNGDEIIAESLKSVMEEFLFHTAYFCKITDQDNYLDFKKSASMPPDQVLNRHGILHGFDHQYISKENSLRVFFAIDSLVFMMHNRKNL